MKSFIKELMEKLGLVFIRMISLKFFFTVIHIVLGIVFMIFLIKNMVFGAGVWGVWAGYMTSGLAIYTTGNVASKKFGKESIKNAIFGSREEKTDG